MPHRTDYARLAVRAAACAAVLYGSPLPLAVILGAAQPPADAAGRIAKGAR